VITLHGCFEQPLDGFGGSAAYTDESRQSDTAMQCWDDAGLAAGAVWDIKVDLQEGGSMLPGRGKRPWF
jgi:hypothetical protein